MVDDPRRNFFVRGVQFLGALIAGGIGVPAVAYIFAPPKAQQKGGWTEVASLEELAPKTPLEISFRRNRIDGWKVTSEKSSAWLVRLDDSRVVAFAPWCTHLGCAYRYDEQKKDFVCPCHTSDFSIEGAVISGPAPRPLDRYEVKVDGNKIWIAGLEKRQEEA
jgi:menaquinol-cytochrome c reductase iron-sulfur subunit